MSVVSCVFRRRFGNESRRRLGFLGGVRLEAVKGRSKIADRRSPRAPSCQLSSKTGDLKARRLPPFGHSRLSTRDRTVSAACSVLTGRIGLKTRREPIRLRRELAYPRIRLLEAYDSKTDIRIVRVCIVRLCLRRASLVRAR